MNLRQVEAFRAIMRTGSASRAADILNVTQPAVSRSISELERTIGFSLFDRVRGRLVPTPESKLFYDDVERTFVSLDTLKHSAAKIRDIGSGLIKIAAMASAASTLVPRAVHAFRKLHPQVSIILQSMDSSDVRIGVANGRYDIGLALRDTGISGIAYQPFTNAPAICGMRADHRLAAKDVIVPADLDGENFIAHTPEDGLRQLMQALMDKNGYTLNVVAETASCDTVLAMALEGIGIGIANPMAASGYCKRGLAVRPFRPEIECKSFLLFRADMQKSRIVRAMAKCLLEARFPDTRQDAPLRRLPVDIAG